METIRLIGRNSRLSLLQIEIVRLKIQAAFPLLKVEVITRSSTGDALQDVPLQTVEGSDFFTRTIFDALAGGEADIAVHSLKDMSSEHFFGGNAFAVVDRDDPRDVAIFNQQVEDKLKKGETIIIGTCSPRREEMATVFLKKALPQLHTEIHIETRPIRGNVETRLKKLASGEYDATLLATAGLNRLLRSEADATLIQGLLANKRIMVLPLVECVPAPCQGAIVAEAHGSNQKAVDILIKINDERLYTHCFAEKKEAIKYGVGCVQQFGVTSIHTANASHVFAAGKDAEGTLFEKWSPLPDEKTADGLFSSTDHMKDFFGYEFIPDRMNEPGRKLFPVLFISNYKQVLNREEADLHKKTILAAGTRTWFELAKQGYWVTACADGLGFEFLLPSLQMPLLGIGLKDILILTHEAGAKRWRAKGYHALSNYRLNPSRNPALCEAIASAKAIFWSSYSQFEFYNLYTQPAVKHMCPAGETASLLRKMGIDPVIFPTIKAFQQWRNSFIRSHSVA